MIGVIILTFGLPVSFEAAAHVESPNNTLMVVGYVVMRVPLIGLWLRAARQDPAHRRIDITYAVTISAAQATWILSAIAGLSVTLTVATLVLLAATEMILPVLQERRLGKPPWNAGHIAERFSLLTLIVLGEVIAATVSAVSALTAEVGWSSAAVVITASGIVLAAGFWWAYFLIPSRTTLERWPERTFAWRYAHLPIFGAIAAVGAGLRVAATAVAERELSVFQIALALAIPVGALVVMIFVTWSVLMKTYDLTHVPLFVLTLVPLLAAVAVAAFAGGTEPIDLDNSADLTILATVVGLIALAAVVEVVGHEVVGYRHTVRVLDQEGLREARTG